jgi:hypothetical protein
VHPQEQVGSGLVDAMRHRVVASEESRMSSLTAKEKRRLEALLGMSSGYVLNFTDRTFSEFSLDVTGKDILASEYAYASGSKANRLPRSGRGPTMWSLSSSSSDRFAGAGADRGRSPNAPESLSLSSPRQFRTWRRWNRTRSVVNSMPQVR